MSSGNVWGDTRGVSIIEVQDLVKRYGDRLAVDGVSFTVEEGEIFGILGPNGAGKTTTVESIAGLRTPDSGTIKVLGLDPRLDRVAVVQLLGVQLQESELPEQIKVWEALDLFASFYHRPANWEQLVVELGLEQQRATAFGKLSGGQKQRLSIALALVGNPTIAILDELTTGLDPQARRDTWQLIADVRARGVTVVLVTHFMEEAERLCDRIALIDGGRIVALDTPAGIVRLARLDQRVQFRPSMPFDERLLTDLAEVHRVTWNGPTVTVAGTSNLLQAVTSVIARNQIVAHDLRLQQADLDDAFVALTGRGADDSVSGTPR
jgi:ABC-2 type transport system ATP-binding protein